MSQFAIILGRSGSGKSRSLKNLDPSKTFVINCLGKTLPFKQSATMYNREAGNMVKTYKWDKILAWLDHVDKKMPNVTTCVIDDCTFVMREEFFDRSGEKSYDKYNELADHFRKIINKARTLRDDLHIYMMLHDDNVESDGSIVGKKVATVGKLLDKQYDPLMSVTITLYCEPQYNDDGTVKQYGFYTREMKVNGIPIPAKCFGRGTLIKMFDGSIKPVENIKVGDEVLTTEGTIGKVKTLYNGFDDLYKVNQSLGCAYIVNSEHLIVTSVGNIQSKEFNSITNGTNIHAVNLPYNNSSQKALEEPYFIGLWLGDGSKDATSITTMEPETIQYLKDLADKYHLNYSIYDTPGSKAVEINLGSSAPYTREILQYTIDGEYLQTFKSIKEASEKLNVCSTSISHCASGKYKHAGGFMWKYGKTIKNNKLRVILEQFNLIGNKHIPQDFKNANLDSRRKFLAGLIDTDGYTRENVVTISTQYQEMAYDILEIAQSCGLYGYISTWHNSIYNKNYYRINMFGDFSKIPIRIPRRLPKDSKHFNRKLNTITVESTEYGEYFGFTLDSECKTFFLHDYTVVHNCPEEMFEDAFIPNDLALVNKTIDEYYGIETK